VIGFRPADLVDRPGNHERRFVLDGWLKSYKNAHAAGLIDAFDWYSTMIPQLDKICGRPGVRTLVAFNKERPPDDVAGLFGFICGEPDSNPPFVYYVFVKEPYRRMGIARGMFEALGVNPSARFDYAAKTGVLSYPANLSLKIPLARWNPQGARYDRDHRRNNG